MDSRRDDRYWPKADIPCHRQMSDLEVKADITVDGQSVR
jgi:hypothetical protein